MTYREVQKSLTLLDSQRAHIRLLSILDSLPNSAKRYDDAMRYEKVKNIKKYFSKRNLKIEILPSDAEIPDAPDDGTLYLR